MVRKRKTKAERERERYDASRRAWEVFAPRLERVGSFLEALKLLSDSVPPDTPGRSYYSNLGFFMQTFSPPAGANASELAQYRRLIELFDNEGALKPGVRPHVEEALDRAIRERVRE